MGSMAKVETDADKTRLRLTKELIKAKELDAIGKYLGELRRWIYVNTVPTFFKEGFQLTSLTGIEPIEARMRKAQGELAELVNDLVAVYPAKIDESKAGLNDQFNPRRLSARQKTCPGFSPSGGTGFPSRCRKDCRPNLGQRSKTSLNGNSPTPGNKSCQRSGLAFRN